MALCHRCDAFFVGTNCASCGWKVIYKCWSCRTKIDPATARACACRWFKCPKCDNCGCGNHPGSREERIRVAVKSATRKFDLVKMKPSDYPFLSEKAPDNLSTVDSWSEWPALKKFPWEWFLTFTFPRDTSPLRASKMWNYYCNFLARIALPAGIARREGLPWVRSIESHRSGNPHVHALIGHVSNINPKLLKWLWGIVAGRLDTNVHVQRFISEGHALAYIVKSASDTTSDIDVSRFFLTRSTK